MMDEQGSSRTPRCPPAEPSAELQKLLALARKSLSGAPPKRHAASLQQVQHRLEQRARRRRVWLGAGAAACLLSTLALASFWLRPAAALHFEVSNGTLLPSGVVEAKAEGTRLSFSDGTQLALDPKGRAQVEALSPEGAELGLERGHAKLDVVHRRGARWSVRAGPYLVRVTGTSFELEFDPEQRWLKLDLLVGSVSVSGPLIDGALQVSAGQRLLVRSGDALVLVQRRDAEEQAAASVPAAATPAVPVEPQPPVVTDEPPAPPAPRQVEPRARRQHPAAREHAAPVASWRERVARGEFAAVLQDAQKHDTRRVLSEAPLDDLEALADAARYARRPDIARPALLALRERFGSARAAREASFLLGRLDESAGDARSAFAWYERYLIEESDGAYAAAALGRQLLLARELRLERAGALAREYLRRFPRGPYAAAAREIVGAD